MFMDALPFRKGIYINKLLKCCYGHILWWSTTYQGLYQIIKIQNCTILFFVTNSSLGGFEGVHQALKMGNSSASMENSLVKLWWPKLVFIQTWRSYYPFKPYEWPASYFSLQSYGDNCKHWLISLFVIIKFYSKPDSCFFFMQWYLKSIKS